MQGEKKGIVQFTASTLEQDCLHIAKFRDLLSDLKGYLMLIVCVLSLLRVGFQGRVEYTLLFSLPDHPPSEIKSKGSCLPAKLVTFNVINANNSLILQGSMQRALQRSLPDHQCSQARTTPRKWTWAQDAQHGKLYINTVAPLHLIHSKRNASLEQNKGKWQLVTMKSDLGSVVFQQPIHGRDKSFSLKSGNNLVKGRR